MDAKELKPAIENIIETIREKKLIRRYFLLTIALFISALQFNLFLRPTHIVSGGANGVAIILEYLFNIEPSLTILIISITLLIISFITLGIEKTSGTIVATIIYPIFVELTKDITNYISVDVNDLLLLSIFIGIITGLTNGIIFKTGFSNGGLNIISQILYKYLHISLSKSNFVINAIVVILGSYYFGVTMLMYAIIIIYINSLVIDKILLGISKNKAFYIVTDKETEVKNYIINELGHSITIFKTKGGYEEKRQNTLFAVVPTKEYYQLTEGIKTIDNKAFFVVTDSYQVKGGS